MTNYAVTVAFNEVIFVEAESKELAEEDAIDQLTAEYGLAAGQAYVDEITEVK